MFIFNNYNIRAKSGLTLIELIMVLVILGICLMPIALLFSHVSVKYSKSEVMQIATYLAQQKMQEVSTKRFSEIANVARTNFGLTGSLADYFYEINVTSNAYNTEKTVLVSVSHDIIGAVTLTTLITKKVAWWEGYIQ